MTDITHGTCRGQPTDEIAIWPYGNWAHIGDIRKGDYHYMSDDYEVVPIDDIDRLNALGVSFDE
ncbi:hypothetical protein [Mesorhizobium sp. L-2-11]|uniref:hypothetical protein n=1 Tax=Mesorhizobium sp. L-2-11 TaxID=2744521 RepID=UPI0019290AF6|nr:hypothetical protein [Mesorhizobium sp. L-2-11]BCH19531.1 hypothetical protein MesoLjLa_63820 [Mesorhizobium sp. L-2-11]